MLCIVHRRVKARRSTKNSEPDRISSAANSLSSALPARAARLSPTNSRERYALAHIILSHTVPSRSVLCPLGPSKPRSAAPLPRCPAVLLLTSRRNCSRSCPPPTTTMIKALALAGLAAVANAGAVELTAKNFEESIAGAPRPPCRSQRIVSPPWASSDAGQASNLSRMRAGKGAFVKFLAPW